MLDHSLAYLVPLVYAVPLKFLCSPFSWSRTSSYFLFRNFSLCSILLIWCLRDAFKVSNRLGMETTKSANSKEKSSNKKLKEIDRTVVSAGSGNSKRTMSSRYWHDVSFCSCIFLHASSGYYFCKVTLYSCDGLLSEDYSAEGSSDVNDQKVWSSSCSYN